jgi:hypothetical protein
MLSRALTPCVRKRGFPINDYARRDLNGGTVNAHNNAELPTMHARIHKISIKHQRHIAKKDVRQGNLWQMLFRVMGVKVRAHFKGGETDGVIEELV